MGINEYVRCLVVLLKTSTIPRKDIFFVFFSIFLTLLRYPNSVLGRTGKELDLVKSLQIFFVSSLI